MPLPHRTRTLALLLGLTLIAAACGTATDDEPTVAAAPAQNSESDSTTDDSTTDDDAMEDEAMEDGGSVVVTIENIGSFAVSDSGAFAVPASASEPGPALPGDAYEFSVYAQPGERLSFATMFVQTNDWFFAPDPAGIELYDADGNPISGDVTDQVFLFDAGTEVDQAVGEGEDQAPRQSGPDSGAADPDANVRLVADRDAANYVSVTVAPAGGGRFDVRIANDSAMAADPTPLAPGVYAAHTGDVALFATGAPDAGDGLEALAEDGDATPLADYLATLTGTTTPLAPGAWAAHTPDVALFALGDADAGLGLEALAEDGDPSGLAEALSTAQGVSHAGAFTMPDGAAEAGPLLPGGSYSFEAPIVDGERLSFATMFVQSNDWIIATPAEGLDLATLSGDITDQLLVVDVGTETDQRPGSGADQAPRQAGPDTGAADDDPTVRLVDGRSAGRYVRVTVEPAGS